MTRRIILLAAILSIAPSVLFGATNVSGAISSDTTWDATGSPYVVSGVTVASGATLTIQPGVIVKFSCPSCVAITVSGALTANGTASQPIYFTSFKDDTVGGDTNGDGNATSPAAGDWSYILFASGSTGLLTNTVIRYGGYYLYAQVQTLVQVSSANVTISNSTLTDSLGNGINITGTTGTPTITQNVFARFTETGVVDASGGTVSSNAFTTVKGATAISISSNLQVTLSGNTSTGPGINAVSIGGSISGKVTWGQTGIPYDIGGLEITSGATLTIQPGVIVKFSCPSCVAITVSGALTANGTASQPIYFTSFKDDTVGGDTNGDGNATSPAAGDWSYILFASGSTGLLTNTVIRYGGYYLYAQVQTLVQVSSANVTISNSTLTDSLGNGINITGTTGTPTITQNVFARFTETGVVDASGGTVSSNAFTTVKGATAISISSNLQVTLSGNTSTGPGINAVSIGGSISGKVTWGQTGIPYDIGGLEITSGATLTIQPGVIVKFSCPSCVAITVSGALTANGTASQPIYFTSFKDDTVGGDTNGDGNATSPAAGDWSYILFASGSTGLLTNTVIRYGGYYLYAQVQTLVQVSSANVTISNSTLTDSLGNGINITGTTGTPTITQNVFARFTETGVVDASGGTVSSNAFTTVKGATAISISSNLQVTLSGNTSTGPGINAVSIGGSISGKVTWGQTGIPYDIGGLEITSGATLTIQPGVIVKFSCPSCVAITVSGALTANGTASQPIYFTSFKDDTVGGDTNGDGNATSPAAGDWSYILFASGSTGLLTNTVIRYGGYYLYAQVQTLVQVSSANVTISNSTLTNSAGDGIYISGTTNVNVSGSTFARNVMSVSVAGSSTPHIHYSSFQLDSSYGILSSASTSTPVDATYNYWGSPTGPWLNPPAGPGDRVSAHVNYIPFIGSSAGTTPTSPQTLVGQNGTTTNPTTSISEPINTATGNYFSAKTDLVVPGKGLPFNFVRSYNSEDSYAGPLGAGWTHSYNIVLTADPTTGNVSVKEADGHVDFYSPAGAGSYVAATVGLFDTLQQNADTSFTLTRKNQTQLNFTPGGQLISLADRDGNMQVLTYDGSGNMASVTDTAGRSFTFTYDGSGRITSVADPINRVWQYAYDANDNLVSVRDAAGGLTQYSYSASNQMTSAVDPRGVTFLQNAYDAQGRVVAQTNARGFVTTLAYGFPVPGTTTITDPLGNSTKNVYDASLRLTSIVDANGGTVSYTYDANNDRLSITNQNGYTTNFSYDAQGNVTGITDALGDIQTFTYDSTSDLLTATSPKGATTSFSYDSKGNLLNIKDALDDISSFTYTSIGQLAAKTDARGDTTIFTYDSAGNLIKATDPLGNSTSFAYDGVSRLITTTDANAHKASLTYDALSRIMKTTDALGNATQFAYDAIGNLLTTTDANGEATNYAYDGTNNLTTVTDALGNITGYSYDANNNRISFTNAKGNSTTYVYDALNRLVRITDPLAFSTSYVYDALGNTASTTDANGNTNQYAYDALNRLVGGRFADGSSVSYAYDKDGNRTSMTDWRGITTYAYDALDRVLSVTSPGPNVVQYSYDAAGNRSSFGYPDGRIVEYQYDSLNRLSQVTDWASKSTHYSYDPVGNLAGFTYPNGASSSYSYDSANRLIQIINRSGAQVLSSFAYGLDNVGNRVQVTSAAGGVTKYGYDALYRLTSWTVPSGQVTQYNYDPAGNRLSLVSSAGTSSYTYDAADQMLSAGTSSYSYDHNGNQISKTTGSTTLNYTYDALNRLSGASGGGIASQYRYDGDGNRVTQTVPTGTYQYLNDTAAGLPVVLNENGPDGNIDYLYGLSLISETSSAFQYLYQTDGLGSAASLTDATGALKASYAYDPWGKLTTPIDSLGTKNKYKFTGEAYDSAEGLYFLRARYYDQSSGRFISRDPLTGLDRAPLSKNRYVYGLSSPTGYVDHRGLSVEEFQSFMGAGLTNVGSTAEFASASSCTSCVPFALIGDTAGLGGGLYTVASGNDIPGLDLVGIGLDAARRLKNGESLSQALSGTIGDYAVGQGVNLALAARGKCAVFQLK